MDFLVFYFGVLTVSSALFFGARRVANAINDQTKNTTLSLNSLELHRLARRVDELEKKKANRRLPPTQSDGQVDCSPSLPDASYKANK